MTRRVARDAPHLAAWGVLLLLFRWPHLRVENLFDLDTAYYLLAASWPPPEGICAVPLLHHPPGILMLLAPFVSLWGPFPLPAVQVFYALLAAAGAWIVLAWGEALAGRRAGVLAGWLFALGLCAPRPFLLPSADLPMILLMLASARAAWQGTRDPEPGRPLFLAGVLAAAAAFFKLQALVQVPADIALVAALAGRRGIVRKVICFAAGAAAGAAAGLACVTATGGTLADLLNWQIVPAFSYSRERWGRSPWALFAYGAPVMLACWGVLWAGAATAVHSACARGWNRPLAGALCVWAALAFLPATQGPYAFSTRYYLPILAPLALLAGMRLAETSRPRPVLLASIALSLAAVLGYHAVYARSPSAEIPRRIVEHARAAGAHIRAGTRETDGIIVLERHWNAVYAHAGRRAGAPFPYWYQVQRSTREHPWYHPAYPAVPAAELERRLLADAPAYLVDTSLENEFGWIRRALPAFAARYRQDAVIGPLVLYRRL